LSQILSDAGVEVSTAENGRQALEKIEKRQPDIVWMDLRMPVMTGSQAVEIIHQRYGDSIACVAVTASSNAETGEREALAQGFDAYIGKPYSMPAIFTITEKLLGVAFIHHAPQVIEVSPSGDDWQGLTEQRRQALSSAAAEHRVTALKREIEQMQHGDDFEQAIAARLAPMLARYNMDKIQQTIQDAEDA